MDNQLEKFVRDNAGAFDTRTPDPAVLARIQQQLAGASGKKQRAVLVPIRVVRFAAACLVLLAGAAIFWIARQPEPAAKDIARGAVPSDSNMTPYQQPVVTDQPSVVKEPATLATVRTPAEEKTNNTSVIERNRQMIFARLQDMDAPSQRMIAASEALKLSDIDHDIIDALTKTLNNDPNTNVRLAALEALGKFQRESYVKKKLVESLKKQSDPMVQIALIDMLTTLRERKILQQLDKMVNDTKTMDAVKDHAYSSIFTLRL
ncbi:HEAT repeat domain-containing protein [Sediminibacterium soli]|uniref:HEAT repeat domain-containing protein n=1 Tax=Sediminibacterium soli TaxID=2698829 RepID=UPI00137ABE2D|nr:HEAT repeat domain-containing protein [Sediminibacterium soli]NCI45604.1 HEAT repeat domain-containing protein [Sediminibacterium soli]